MVVPNSVNSTASYWLKEKIKEPVSIGIPSDNFARSYWLNETKKAADPVGLPGDQYAGGVLPSWLLTVLRLI